LIWSVQCYTRSECWFDLSYGPHLCLHTSISLFFGVCPSAICTVYLSAVMVMVSGEGVDCIASSNQISNGFIRIFVCNRPFFCFLYTESLFLCRFAFVLYIDLWSHFVCTVFIVRSSPTIIVLCGCVLRGDSPVHCGIAWPGM